ncbi:hypothetical protein C8Q79DRAFT_902407 [Trametes meyenii]|nr:hypothetical protein C8Q79DRAFT_902407 [Trametes meyenii]
MRLSSVLFSALLCAASARAQYFSAGWTPGQPVPPADPQGGAPPPAHTFERAAAPLPTPDQAGAQPQATSPASALKSLTSLLDMNRLLTSGPVASLFGKIGVNITEAVAKGAASPWDERVPLLTDESFDDIVVREVLTEQEEKDRVWFIIISVSAGQNKAVSKFVDESFDKAFNETVAAGDLPNVRWGRIDYINVTYLTTKWAVWTGPYLLVLTDRGQTLRFYKADRVRITPELIRELLVEELWRNSAPWKTNFAPGGKREWVLHYYAVALTYIFNFVNRFPRWMLMIASGAVASFVMRLLHKNPEAPTPAPTAAPVAPQIQKQSGTESAVSQESATAVASSTATTASPSKSKGKLRKNAKK